VRIGDVDDDVLVVLCLMGVEISGEVNGASSGNKADDDESAVVVDRRWDD